MPRMAQRCSICSGPVKRLNSINEQLRKKVSFKKIALAIGDVSKASIGRHALRCLTRTGKKSIRNQIPIVLWPDGSAYIRRDYGSNGCSITPVTIAEINALDHDEYCVWQVKYEKPSAEALANMDKIAATKVAPLIALEPETPPEIPPAA
jgi:hypothetical protein